MILSKIGRLGLIARNQPATLPAYLRHHSRARQISKQARQEPGYIAHVGTQRGNAGDIMIAYAQYRLFDKLLGPQRWSLEPARAVVTSGDVRRINAQAKAIVVGGGGLLLPTYKGDDPDNMSDWQWNISIDLLREVDVPIVLFGVGYNRMRGLRDFKPFFWEQIGLTIEKARFVGLRNQGSIDKLKTYLPEHLHHKLVFQPCPTNVMSIVDPVNWAAKREVEKRNIAFVLSPGQPDLGLAESRDKLMQVIAVAKPLAEKGWKIHLSTHTRAELSGIKLFDDLGVPYQHTMLDMLAPADIVKYYTSKALVIGMRGHGVMLPYGLGVPVIGVVHHDKVKFFLDQVGLSDYAVDIDADQLPARLLAMVEGFYADPGKVHRIIDEGKKSLFDTTVANFQAFAPYVGGLRGAA